MRDARRMARALLASAAMLLVVGCGDDAVEVERLSAKAIDGSADDAEADAGDETGGGDAPDASGGGSGEDEGAGSGDATSDSTEEPAAGGGADGEAFARLIASERAVGITYEVQGRAAGPERVTFVRDGSAVALVGTDAHGEARLVRTDERLVACGRHSGDWKCLRLDGLGEVADLAVAGALGPFLLEGPGVIGSQDWSDYEIATIAGRTARCVSPEAALEIQSPGFSHPAEICADEETGALLRVASADGGSDRFEAVEVGGPDTALLEPPTEPIDFGILHRIGDALPDDLEGFDLEEFGLNGNGADASDI